MIVDAVGFHGPVVVQAVIIERDMDRRRGYGKHPSCAACDGLQSGVKRVDRIAGGRWLL